MTSNSPEVSDEENYTDEREWWKLSPVLDEDECKHCNGTGLSDLWDEESYCEMCYGLGFLAS